MEWCDIYFPGLGELLRSGEGPAARQQRGRCCVQLTPYLYRVATWPRSPGQLPAERGVFAISGIGAPHLPAGPAMSDSNCRGDISHPLVAGTSRSA